MYEQGSLVLVPFPFTDLSSLKKRPAVVISPDWFNKKQKDIILMAVTASISRHIDKKLEILISRRDLSSGTIPKKSMVKISKIFTCHKGIVVKKIAMIKKEKLNEILEKLRSFIC